MGGPLRARVRTETEPFWDDSVGFDRVEEEYLNLDDPELGFAWLDLDRPSPRNALRMPLAEARVALLSTAGARLPNERPLGAGGRARPVPIDAPVILDHEGYDVDRSARDPETVFPVGALRRLVAAGVIGSLAPTAISTMGYTPRGHHVLERAVPASLELLRSEEVDLALLVPA